VVINIDAIRNQPSVRLPGLYFTALRLRRLRLLCAGGFRREAVFLGFFLVTFYDAAFIYCELQLILHY
jgi:hypothetical protein